MSRTGAHERIPAVSADERGQGSAPASEPIEHVASETFGWIHPDVATQSITRRGLRPRHRHLVPVALWMSMLSIVVSWFGPWAAPVALVAAMLAAVALFRRIGRVVLAWIAIGASCVSLLFSAYWVTWILTQLPVAP